MPSKQVIRNPLAMFPLVLAFYADTLVALARITKFLTAEDLSVPYTIENNSDYAVQADGSFSWDSVKSEEKLGKGPSPETAKEKPTKKGKSRPQETVLPVTSEKQDENADSGLLDEDPPFHLKDLHLKIRKGSFVAIVGRVGTGKVT